MTGKQLLNTLSQISSAESTGALRALLRHSCWEARRLMGLFPVDLSISESRIRLDGPTGVGALVNCLGLYDYNNMHLIKLVLAMTGGCFFDVGANIGSYTLVASEVARARVVSFEPHPITFAALARNVRMNERSNVLCLNVALSDHEGLLELTDLAECSINRVRDEAGGGGRSLPVPARTLDSVCEESDVLPTVLKIDVEGYELQVLRGLQRGIACVGLALIEGGAGEHVRSLMLSAGFAGPYHYWHRNKEFSDKTQPRPEDPVFVSPGLRGALAELGFSFAS